MKKLKYLYLILCLNIFFGCKYISETITDESKEIVTEEKDQLQEEKDQLQELNEKSNQMTEEDLKFESIFEKRSLFIKKGENFKEAFYGLSKDSIRIEFLSDSPVKSIAIIEERSSRPVKIFKNKNKID